MKPMKCPFGLGLHLTVVDTSGGSGYREECRGHKWSHRVTHIPQSIWTHSYSLDSNGRALLRDGTEMLRIFVDLKNVGIKIGSSTVQGRIARAGGEVYSGIEPFVLQ